MKSSSSASSLLLESIVEEAFLVGNRFHIGFNTDPMFIRIAPVQYRNPRRIFCPVSIAVGAQIIPGASWCDLAGVLLLEWCRAVWRMSAGQSRYARLIFFDTPTEIWLRRTTTQWWKVSAVHLEGERTRISSEVLCLPERAEAKLLAAAQHFLAGVRLASVWGVDCDELAKFLHDQSVEIPTPPDAAPDQQS